MDDHQFNPRNPEAEVHVLLSGIMGRPKVVEAIFGDGVKTEEVEVPGYGLRIQQIEDIGPASVREDMATVWKDKPYMGAVGVVKSPGEKVLATRITTNLATWRKARELIQKFNYHEYKHTGDVQNAWFHNEGVKLPGHEEEQADIIEAFADNNKLKKIEDVYEDPQKFEEQLAHLEPIMAEDLIGFRKNVIEGNSTDVENKG